MTADKAARAFVDQLLANVDAYYAGRASYEAFSASNRAVWEAIRAADPAVETLVLALLRERLTGEKDRRDQS